MGKLKKIFLTKTISAKTRDGKVHSERVANPSQGTSTHTPKLQALWKGYLSLNHVFGLRELSQVPTDRRFEPQTLEMAGNIANHFAPVP